jgi:hypothetical protein
MNMSGNPLSSLRDVEKRRSSMPVSKRRNGSLLGLLAVMAAAIFLLPASQASAVTFDNACVNSLIATQSSSIPVTMTGETSTAGPVKAGDSITLEEIEQELAVPPSVFVAGYNAGVLTTGLNKIPTKVKTRIRGTNTVEESQLTNVVETEAETTITDPNGEPGTGDETATPGTVSVAYADQIWTAGASGPINFRQSTVIDPKAAYPPGFTNLNAGILIESVVAGVLTVRFGCDPGEVGESAPPSTIKLETAPAFATLVNENAANRAPTANAGPDQKVATGAKVTLNGAGSSDSSEETFALKFKWTQEAGPAVTLTGGTTPVPFFTAPAQPGTVTFELEVCDNGGPSLCSTDEVVVSAGNSPPTANAGPDQEVDSGAGVTLNGSGSSDPNGDPLTYEWTQTGGPGAALSGAETANAGFTAPSGPATLTFELEVCDNGGPSLCSTDSVVITVKAPPAAPGPGPEAENKAPSTKLQSTKVKKRKVTFKFGSDEKGSTFLCKLDKKKFAKCKSPKTYKGLKPGRHKFQVKAVDPQGKPDPSAAVKTFKIKKGKKKGKK